MTPPAERTPWIESWFAPMPAERLAALRLLIGLYAAIYTVARLPHLLRYLDYPPALYRPVGVFVWVAEPLPSMVYACLIGATVVSSAAFVLGYRYRFLGPLYAGLLLVTLTYPNCFGKILHTDNGVVFHVLILALLPAADALALDAAALRTQASHPRAYGWGVRLLAAATVAVYVLAAIAKLRNSGLDFVGGETLRNYVAFDNVRKLELGSISSPLAAWLLPFPWVFALLAVASLALEVFAPVALFRRKWGRWFSVTAWAFHFGVLLLMAIGFAYQLTGIAFAPFFDVERWLEGKRARRILRRLHPPSSPGSAP